MMGERLRPTKERDNLAPICEHPVNCLINRIKLKIFSLKKNKPFRSILAKSDRKQFRVMVSYPEGHITGSMILRRSRDADIQQIVNEINSKIRETENATSSKNVSQYSAR